MGFRSHLRSVGRRPSSMRCGVFGLTVVAALGVAPGLHAAPAAEKNRILRAADFRDSELVLPAGDSVLVEVHPGEAPLELRLTLEPAQESGPAVSANPRGLLEISVSPRPRVVQRLRVPVDRTGDVIQTSLSMRDFNFDGYLDLAVPHRPVGGVTHFSYYLYRPSSGTFVADQLTARMEELPGLPAPDAQRRQLVFSTLSVECRAPLVRAYEIQRDDPVLVREESGALDGSVCVVTTRERIDGEMRVTATRRITTR
jgi:hypothetical protein